MFSTPLWDGKRCASASWRIEASPGYPLVAPAIEDELFQIVGHALYNDESLDITYRTSRDSAPKQYRALPHALIEKGPLWYLIVKNKRRTAEGSLFPLRMDRIIEARPAGIDLTRDRTFSLDAYIRQDRGRASPSSNMRRCFPCPRFV